MFGDWMFGGRRIWGRRFRGPGIGICFLEDGQATQDGSGGR